MEVERAGAGECCLCSSANTTQVTGGAGAAPVLETKPGQWGSARTGIPGAVPRTRCHPLPGVLSHRGDSGVTPGALCSVVAEFVHG